jgi:hypothetical protein
MMVKLILTTPDLIATALAANNTIFAGRICEATLFDGEGKVAAGQAAR